MRMNEKDDPAIGATGPIVLLTDFGLSDPFVGQMKGVIARVSPETSVINLCHHVPPMNVLVAAMFLKGSCRYFPPGSIFVVVVDPGVGTSRNAIMAESGDQYFIGPDNGCLAPIIESRGASKVVRIENPAYIADEISQTFHGRDIFAPAAAHLAAGVPLDSFGSQLETLVTLDQPEPELVNKEVHGKIIYIDHFGNAWTNVSMDFLREIGWTDKPEKIVTTVASCKIKGLRESYLSDKPNKPIALINSFDLVEIAWPGGSAREKLRLWEGVWVDMNIAS